MIQAVDKTTADGWKPARASSLRVDLMKKVTEGNPVVIIRGQAIIPDHR